MSDTAEPKRSIGRPSNYTPEIADTICEAIARGGALYLLCDQEDGWPHEATVYRWLEKHEDFREKYARARERQADRNVDEIIAISDESGFDAYVKDGRAVIDSEAVNRARLRVDSRKWRASKLWPKKYGDKITQEQTGAGGGPIKHVHTIERRIVDPGE